MNYLLAADTIQELQETRDCTSKAGLSEVLRRFRKTAPPLDAKGDAES
jgi:hypothetical protein